MKTYFNLFTDNQCKSCRIFILCLLSFVHIIDANPSHLHSTTLAVEPQVSTTEKSNELFEAQVCTTAECVRSATEIRTAMNTSVDPCDDFYDFACGRWSTEYPSHKGYTQSSTIVLAIQNLLNDVHKLLESNETENESIPLRKSRDMFRSCMDEESRESLGYGVVFKYLSQLGLPAVPRFFNLSDGKEDIKDYKFDWIKTDATFHAIFRVPLLVYCNAETNIHNTRRDINNCKTPEYKFRFYNLEVTPSKVDTLYDVEIYTENQTAVQEAWQKLTNFTITTLIKEKYDLPADFQERFDAAIEVIKKTENYISKVKNLSKKLELGFVTYDSLEEDEYLFNNNGTINLNWEQYVDEMSGFLNLTGDSSKIGTIVQDIFYYRGINAMISNVSKVELELWAWWRSVLNLIIYTTSEATDHVNEIFNASNMNHELSREIVCTSLTTYSMDFAVAHALTDQFFQNITKPKVQEIWNNISKAFEIRVNDLTWMDEKTKNLTIEKSKAMKSIIGYPEWLENKTMLENYYSQVNVNADTYLDNLIEFNKFKRQRDLEHIILGNNREWPRQASVMQINAYHIPHYNVMAIPFATIKYLFYNRGLETLNYGFMGSVLGHELTHGFDNMGRHFDKTGTFREWWSNSTSLDFSNMTECFVDQYDQFYVSEFDAYVNGTVTLGENLADNGGLNNAYLAYQNQKKKNEEELRLPGLEQFTNDQLFFIANTNFQCSAKQIYNTTDTHSPGKVRVIGSLMNSEEFATAFNCPLGSNMNPKKSKCKIW